MSEGIRDINTVRRSEIQSQKKKSAQEIEALKKHHESHLRGLKQSQEEDLHQVREQHLLDVAEAVHLKEQKLESLRKSMEQTRRIAENETKRQQTQAFKLGEDAKQRSSAEIEHTKLMREEALKNLNAQFIESQQSIHREGQQQLSSQDEHNTAQLRANGQHWRQKLHDQKDLFQNTFKNEENKQQASIDNQKSLYTKTALETHRQHQQRMAQMGQEQTKQSHDLTQNHQKALVSKEKFFEKRYQQQMAQHAGFEENLNGRHTKAIEEAKEQLTKRVEVEQNRSTDSFFAFTELRPTVIDNPEHYVLQVPVPEYSKEEVTLTANHKEMVLSFNRRYQDERKDLDGTVKKVNKVESMVSRIPVSHVLDSKDVTKSWNDGVLTFTVKKA